MPKVATNLRQVPESNMQRVSRARPAPNNGLPLFTVQMEQPIRTVNDRH